MKTAMKKFVSSLRSIFHQSVWNNMKSSQQKEIELEDLSKPIMEQIINTPGHQHIIEMIFFNLDFEDLMNCQLINKSSKNILENCQRRTRQIGLKHSI